MSKSAPDAISASPYGLGSDRVRTPSTVNALPGSRPGRITTSKIKMRLCSLPPRSFRSIDTRRTTSPFHTGTNTIEGLHRQVRKAIKTRGHFPDEQAATKLIYLALIKADAKWQKNRAWTAARAALNIYFAVRFPG